MIVFSTPFQKILPTMKVYYPDGGFYEGQIVAEQRNGKGIYKFGNTVYDGEFQNDNFINGKITLIIDFQTELALQISSQHFKIICEHEQMHTDNIGNNKPLTFFQRTANSNNAECICYLGAYKIFRYVGAIELGLWNGQGQLETLSWYYNGEFTEGNFNGSCLWQQLELPSRYHGNIDKNLFSGHGEFIFGSIKYSGLFTNGYMQGIGNLSSENYQVQGCFTKYLLDSKNIQIQNINKDILYSRYIFQLDLYQNQIINNLSEIQNLVYNIVGDNATNDEQINIEQQEDDKLRQSNGLILAIPYSIDPLDILENKHLWKGILNISIEDNKLEITMQSGIIFKGKLQIDDNQLQTFNTTNISISDVNTMISMTHFDSLQKLISNQALKSNNDISYEEQDIIKSMNTHKIKELFHHAFQCIPHYNIMSQIEHIDKFLNQLDLSTCYLDGELLLPDGAGNITTFVMYKGKILQAQGTLKDQVFQYEFEFKSDDIYLQKLQSKQLDISEYKQIGKFLFHNDTVSFNGKRTQNGYNGMLMDKQIQITCTGSFAFNFEKCGQCSISFQNNKILEAFFVNDRVVWDKKVLYDNKQIQVTNNKLIVMHSDNEKLLMSDKSEIDIQIRKILAILCQYTRQYDKETEDFINLYINSVQNQKFDCYQYTNTLNEIKIGQFLGIKLQGFGLKYSNDGNGVFIGQFNNDNLVSGTIITQNFLYLGKYKDQKLVGKGLLLVLDKKLQTFIGNFQANQLNNECKILFNIQNTDELINYHGNVNAQYLISGEGTFKYGELLNITGIYQELEKADINIQNFIKLPDMYHLSYSIYQQIDILVGNLISNNGNATLQSNNRSLALSSVFTNTSQRSQVSFELLQQFSQQIYAISCDINLQYLKLEDLAIQCLDLQRITLPSHNFIVDITQTTGKISLQCADFSIKFIPQTDIIEVAMKVSEYVKMDVTVHINDQKEFTIQKGIIHNLQTDEKVSFGDTIVQETQDYVFNADNNYFGTLNYKNIDVNIIGQFSEQQQLVYGIITNNTNQTIRIGCFTAAQEQAGFSIFITPEFLYQGEFNEGVFDGLGQLYLCNNKWDDLVQVINEKLRSKVDITSFQQWLSELQIGDYIFNVKELKYYAGNFEGNNLADHTNGRFYHQLGNKIIQEFTGNIQGFQLQNGILQQNGVKINGYCVGVNIWKGDLNFQDVQIIDGIYIINDDDIQVSSGKLKLLTFPDLEFEFLTPKEATKLYLQFLHHNIIPDAKVNNILKQTIKQPESKNWNNELSNSDDQDLKLSGLKVVEALEQSVFKFQEDEQYQEFNKESTRVEELSLLNGSSKRDPENETVVQELLCSQYNQDNIKYRFDPSQQIIKIQHIQQDYLIFLGNLQNLQPTISKLNQINNIILQSGLLNHKDYCYIGSFEPIEEVSLNQQQYLRFHNIFFTLKQGYLLFWNYGFTFYGQFQQNEIDTGKITISKDVNIQILQQQIQALGHKQLGTMLNEIVPLFLDKQQVDKLQINIKNIKQVQPHFLMAQSEQLSFIYDIQNKKGYVLNVNITDMLDSTRQTGVQIPCLVQNYNYRTEIGHLRRNYEDYQYQPEYDVDEIYNLIKQSNQYIHFQSIGNQQYTVVHQKIYQFTGSWKLFSFLRGEFHDMTRNIIFKGQFDYNQLTDGVFELLNFTQLSETIRKLDIQFCNYINTDFIFKGMKIRVTNGSFGVDRRDNALLPFFKLWSQEGIEGGSASPQQNSIETAQKWLELLQIRNTDALVSLESGATCVILLLDGVLVADSKKALKLKTVQTFDVSKALNTSQWRLPSASNAESEPRLFRKREPRMEPTPVIQDVNKFITLMENLHTHVEKISFLSQNLFFIRNDQNVRLEQQLPNGWKNILELNINAEKSHIQLPEFKFKGQLAFNPQTFQFKDALQYIREGLLFFEESQTKLSGQFRDGKLNGIGAQKDHTGVRNGYFIDGELVKGRFTRHDGVIFDIDE